MSITNEIERLQTAKANIKASIENKGVTVGDGTLDTYASKIDEISTSSAVLGTKNITENGIYNASDDNLDGYSQVNVQTSGIDEYLSDTISGGYGEDSPGWIKTILKLKSPLTIIGNNCDYMFSNLPLTTIPQIDTSDVESMESMFNRCIITTAPQINTSKAKSIERMFANCTKLITIPQINTSNVENMEGVFSYCIELQTVPQLNASKVTRIVDMFYGNSKLTNFGGLLNYGQAFLTTQSANNYFYKLNLSDCRKLTHESLMNIINGLYDIKTKGCNVQSLILGSTNLAKLTSEEIAIATNKGWTVS